MLLQMSAVAAFIVAGGSAPLSDPGPDTPGCAHAKSAARLVAAERCAPPEHPAAAALADTDVLHYHLDIELDIDAEWIGGSNTMTVRSLVDGLSDFQFRLDDAFTITAVEIGGNAAAWNRIDNATIDVTLDHAYAVDEEFELTVDYDGNPDSGGFGSIRFRYRGGSHPEVWTLSEPWYAHTWWPCKDDNRDKTTADLWFTVDDEITVASNGALQGVDSVAGGKLRYRWKTDYQTADYLYCIGATDYETFGDVWTHDTGSMPLDFYIYPESNTSDNRDAWLENLDMLDVFSTRYGLYPFANEKYGMCQVGFGGGMEHQTMTSQGGFWESITAHELAHQWFGDMITCATWHDIWLNEGFASYSEAIWWGERPDGTTADYHARMEARRPTQVNDSVYVYDTSDVGRIFSTNFTYRKAAWALHMLRHAIGDTVFFDIIDAYRAAYAYDSATTEDFRLVAEGVHGGDLAWFFDQWIYDIGAPEYAYAWQNVSAGGQSYVELYIEQVQNASYPTFAMPIDVAVSGGTFDELAIAWNDAETEHFLIPVPGDADSVELDPDVWILHTGISSTSFVEGPPRVIATSPAPGASAETGDGLAISVVFHENVIASAGDFSLVGDSSGAIPFAYAYDPLEFTATLTVADAPDADDYTLTIDDGVTDVAGGLALDGEVADALDPGALPSGEGLPGGTAIVRFTLTGGGMPGDLDEDGDVDFNDLLILLAAWGPCGVPRPADLDDDNEVGFQDLLILLASWT